MNKFEATILFNPDLTNKSLLKELDSFKSYIVTLKGEIINNEDWGLRDLSYNINSFKKTFYQFFQLELTSDNISTIKNNLNQNEIILRYLFIKVDNHQELPTKILNEEK